MSRFHAPRTACLAGALSVALVLGSCEAVQEIVMEPFRGETPHERYVELLERSGFGEAALARDWNAAARNAVLFPVATDSPMTESGWLPPEAPTALGYRVEMERGQRLSVEFELEDDGDTEVFIDVFRLRGERDPDDPSLLTVASAESSARSVTYDASATGSFLIRIQPELLRGGPYRVSLRVGPSLAFPVEGAELRDIGSFFGAARDGGARQHHGVDIFSPRGTPVLAASDGVVRRARETPVGGLNVWVRSDESGHSEYYAHLDSYRVEAGQQVSVGDTLGFVGNTGNAITTPPHLHFGIYARGAVDPLPYLRDPGGTAAPLRVDADWFHRRAVAGGGGTTGGAGGAGTTGGAGAVIFAGPSNRTDTVFVVESEIALHVMAGSGSWARVRLPDGRQGFIDPGRLEGADDPVEWHRLAARHLTGAHPGEAAGGP